MHIFVPFNFCEIGGQDNMTFITWGHIGVICRVAWTINCGCIMTSIQLCHQPNKIHWSAESILVVLALLPLISGIYNIISTPTKKTWTLDIIRIFITKLNDKVFYCAPMNSSAWKTILIIKIFQNQKQYSRLPFRCGCHIKNCEFSKIAKIQNWL